MRIKKYFAWFYIAIFISRYCDQSYILITFGAIVVPYFACWSSPPNFIEPNEDFGSIKWGGLLQQTEKASARSSASFVCNYAYRRPFVLLRPCSVNASHNIRQRVSLPASVKKKRQNQGPKYYMLITQFFQATNLLFLVQPEFL